MIAATDSARAGSGPRMRVPDFFIVGHAKSGTTALYELLKLHPQIFMSEVKEPQFFARSETPAVDLFEQTGRTPETLEQYLSLFTAAAPEQLIGDASTFYLWSHQAPERIARAQPGARIIAILREPASFLHSLHLQMLQNNTESERDLRDALALEDERRAGRRIPPHAHWPAALIYSERVHYVEQLRRFHSFFGDENMLVLIYDDFKRDNDATVKRVLRFLGVQESVPVETINANLSVEVRSVRVYTMMRDVREGRNPVGRVLRTLIKSVTSSRVRAAVLYPLRRRIAYRAPVEPDPALIGELRLRFKGEVVALSEYLDRDLVTEWGYDDVA